VDERPKGPEVFAMISRRKPYQSSQVALLTAATLVAMLAVGCQSAENAPPASASQAATPAEFLKQRGLQGRVALVQFGLVGCALSEEGIGKMIGLNRDHRIEGLAFARVEAAKQSKDTDDYFAAKSPGFPIHYDIDNAVGRMFDATVWPIYVLVDKFGRVRYRGPWPDEAKLIQWAAALGKETTDSGPNVAVFDVAALAVPKLLSETRLPDLDGAVKPLRDRMGPKGLLAVFVDTNCPFSATAINEMSSVASVLAKQEVSSVVVNIGEAKAVVEEFYAKRQMGMPVIYDTGRATQTAWAVTSVPTVILMDSGGTITYRGKAVWADVGAAAEKSLQLPNGSLKFTVKGTGFG
jgi:hypothetical protein